MIWKKRHSNLIVAIIFSIFFTITTLLLVIGPLHINAVGGMFSVSYETLSAVIFWALSVVLTWSFYFTFRSYPAFLFFLLMLYGIAIIIAEVFMWGHFGS